MHYREQNVIGVGTPGSMRRLLEEVKMVQNLVLADYLKSQPSSFTFKVVPVSKLAVHCHDTYGQVGNVCSVRISKVN